MYFAFMIRYIEHRRDCCVWVFGCFASDWIGDLCVLFCLWVCCQYWLRVLGSGCCSLTCLIWFRLFMTYASICAFLLDFVFYLVACLFLLCVALLFTCFVWIALDCFSFDLFVVVLVLIGFFRVLCVCALVGFLFAVVCGRFCWWVVWLLWICGFHWFGVYVCLLFVCFTLAWVRCYMLWMYDVCLFC